MPVARSQSGSWIGCARRVCISVRISLPMIIFGVEIKSALRQEKSFYIVKMALFGTFKSSVPTEGTNVLCIVPNID
jgi:hypothetical protein